MHPFCTAFPPVPTYAPAESVAVGADGTPESPNEMGTMGKLALFSVGLAFAYYLGQRNGRVDGYVAGAEAGEDMALKTILAHKAVHNTHGGHGGHAAHYETDDEE
ncbi:MAG: hypothetical protein ACHREM_12220 [Polyangiales bacterium]